MSFPSRLRYSRISFRQLIALLLVATLVMALAPSTLAARGVKNAAETLLNGVDSARLKVAKLLGQQASGRAQDSGRMPARQVVTGVRPAAGRSKEEHEGRVATLRLNVAGEVTLESGQPLIFSGIPFDSEGNAEHGLQAEWESSDKSVVRIRQSGEAVAGRPGTATLTAKAGRVRESVRVTVVEKTRGEFGGKKREDSRRRPRQVGANIFPNKVSRVTQKAGMKRQHGALVKAGSPKAPLPMRDPNDDPLPDDETASLYQASNATGAPPGKTKPGAMTAATATGGNENGQSNYSFSFPIVGLRGRGLDLSLSLTYNSQVWHKSTDSEATTHVTYDVDSDWPAPGFRISYGQIEDQGSAGFTLVDGDGTRHELAYTSAYNYDTKDGSFIHFYGASGWGTAYYPDGTQVSYGAAGGGYRSYPVAITDRNGNEIWISYAGTNGVGPKIASVTDTLQRHIYFNYASNGDLVAITAPGLGSAGDQQVMRFYYASTDINLNASGLFSGVAVEVPSSGTAHVLEAVYLPNSSDGSGAHIGYKFEYSSYGMIYRTTQYRGMTASSTSLTSAGTVSDNNDSYNSTRAALTTYDFPGTSVNNTTGLSDVPKYTTRTDEWAGRTTSGSAPSYTFANSTATNEKILIVTAPDGTITETHTNDKPGQWDDGLVIKVRVGDSSGPTWLTETTTVWEQDSNSANARIASVKSKNVSAGLTQAAVFSYTSYNNVSAVSERAFTTDGSISSTELRRTETSYVTSSNYTNRHLLHLPSTVQIFPGGSGTPLSRVDFAYDNYGSSHADLTPRSDIVMHAEAFNPFTLAEGKCEYDCIHWHNEVCTQYGWICPYDATTDYRGNVTSVTTYTDAATPSGSITHASKYDVAGNVTSSEVDCCQLKTISYTDTPNSHTYAYPISVTSGPSGGPQLTSSATYDLHTGLVKDTTDANGQTTTNYYNSDSLRLNHIQYPTGGGSTYFYYGDGLLPHDNNTNFHYYTLVSREIDNSGTTANNWVDSYQFYDGRGAVAQSFFDGTGSGSWNSVVAQYDAMGRTVLTSNPFSTGGYTNGDLHVGSSDPVTTVELDHLGRVKTVTRPTGDTGTYTTQTSFNYDGSDSDHDGILTTVTDPATRLKRQKVDALGFLVRLDEPDSSTGNLESSGTVIQPTTYTYDALGNLLHVYQPGPSSVNQHRYFKYDSLSRLIRERQVEQTVNSSYDLSDSVNSSGSWTSKIEYNSAGHVTEADDPRGIRTLFSYDGLNRVTQIQYKNWDNSDQGTATAHYYYDSFTGVPSGHPSYTLANATGRLVAMTYGDGPTGNYFNYDANGRVVSQWQVTGSGPTTYSLSYAYNRGGMLTSETYPSGHATTYAYGYAGILSSVSQNTGSSTTLANNFSYDPGGGLSSETWGNGAVHTLSYNRALQPKQVKLASSGGTVLEQLDYGYGTFNSSTGNVDVATNTGQIGKIQSTIGTTAQWLQGLSYDKLGRLSNITEYQGSSTSTQTYTQSYTYDRWGNRFQSGNTPLGLPAVVNTDIVGSTNRFITTGSTPMTYDAAGNITQDMKFRLNGAVGRKYSYDANGRETTTKDSNDTTLETSVYDCGGQRVQTTAGGVTRTMVYDIFGHDVAEYSGSTTLVRENIYRGGLLATYETSGSSYKYVLQDIQGSTRAVMEHTASSTILARHDYLPFGEELWANGTTRTSGYGSSPWALDNVRQRFAQTERDDTTGLDHTAWRKYESASGRWTTPDPYRGSAAIANPQSFNRYAYSLNDPVNLIDPTGLMCYNIIRTDYYADTGEIIGSYVVGTLCTGNGFLNPSEKPKRDRKKVRKPASRNKNKFQRHFYEQYGALFNKCFKDKAGADAGKFNKQTLANAPDLDVDTVSDDWSGTNSPHLGTFGTIYIESRQFRGTDLIENYGTYAHELADIMDERQNPGWFGKNALTYGNEEDTFDKDTGRAVELCMFPELAYDDEFKEN